MWEKRIIFEFYKEDIEDVDMVDEKEDVKIIEKLKVEISEKLVKL